MFRDRHSMVLAVLVVLLIVVVGFVGIFLTFLLLLYCYDCSFSSLVNGGSSDEYYFYLVGV